MRQPDVIALHNNVVNRGAQDEGGSAGALPCRKVFGPNDPKTAEAAAGLGSAYDAVEKGEKAAATAKENIIKLAAWRSLWSGWSSHLTA